MQIVNVLGFSMPYYKSPTLLLSLGLSIRVFWHLIMTRPDVIHVSSPGVMVFAGILYAKLLDLPLVVSYHTHIPGQPAQSSLSCPFMLNCCIYHEVSLTFTLVGCRLHSTLQAVEGLGSANVASHTFLHLDF